MRHNVRAFKADTYDDVPQPIEIDVNEFELTLKYWIPYSGTAVNWFWTNAIWATSFPDFTNIKAPAPVVVTKTDLVGVIGSVIWILHALSFPPHSPFVVLV